jgi:cell division protein FtsL
MSGRISFVLLALLVASALSLVKAQYQSRRLFVELEQAQGVARQLDVDWSQLQLEQSTLGKHARLEELAQRDLKMVHLSADRVRYVQLEGK